MQRPNRHQLGTILIASLYMTAISVCAPGCRVVRLFFPSEQIEIAPDPSLQPGAPAPIDSASTRGLEVRLWVVDDTDWTTTRLLQSQLEQSQLIDGPDSINSIGDEVQAQWNAWGFRVVMIPIDQVQGFLDALRPLQPTNVQWLGEFGQWRPIIRAGNLPTTMVRVGNGVAVLENGRPRMIARSWVQPIMGPDEIHAGVRLDLALQIETSKRPSVMLVESQRERMVEDDGPIIDELLCSAVFDGTHAMVIVGDAPDSDWALLPMSAQAVDAIANPSLNKPSEFGPSATDLQANPDGAQLEPDLQESPSANATAPRTPRPSVAQPAKPYGQTLGELMLTSPGSRTVRLNEARVVPRRVVVVLVPRTQGGFTLLPSVANTIRSNEAQGKTQP